MSRVLAFVAATSVAACVLAVRVEHAFKEVQPATGLRSLTIDLPHTDLHVEGVVGATHIGYEGAWYSTGGTEKVAQDAASKPKLLLNYDRDGAGELVAHVPLSVENLVDLELWKVLLPAALDLEIDGSYGDISLYNIAGYHFVDVEDGNVTVVGADTGIYAHTGVGDISLQTVGTVDAKTGIGDIEVVQTGAGADVRARAALGSITLTLPSLENVALSVSARDRIDIRSTALVKVTDGNFSQTLGDGSVVVEVHGLREVVIRDADWVDTP